MTDKRKHISRFVLRQPFALLGAIAILGLLRDLLQWHDDLNTWLAGFQAMTQPLWTFLLGGLFEEAGWPFPLWIRDYLTVALAAALMQTTFSIREPEERRRPPLAEIIIWPARFVMWFLISILVWPFLLLVQLDMLIVDGALLAAGGALARKKMTPDEVVFWESGICVLIIIAANYALIFMGPQAV